MKYCFISKLRFLKENSKFGVGEVKLRLFGKNIDDKILHYKILNITLGKFYIKKCTICYPNNIHHI